MKKGVSIAAVTATITIMIILITVVTISGHKMSENSKRSNFALEIYSIQQAVDSYLQNNPNDYPILSSVIINLTNVADENKLQFTNNNDIITDNKISLFEIDYDKIGYSNLKYGNKQDGENDIYLLSAVSGKVYYAKGFIASNEVYYTLTPTLEKVLEYKTTDTVLNTNNAISYEQEIYGTSQIKVKVKIPTDFSVTSVKIDEDTYTAIAQDGYNLYEVIGESGDVIHIIYSEENITKATSYTILDIK